jgi:hypothetical protein
VWVLVVVVVVVVTVVERGGGTWSWHVEAVQVVVVVAKMLMRLVVGGCAEEGSVQSRCHALLSSLLRHTRMSKKTKHVNRWHDHPPEDSGRRKRRCRHNRSE